MVPHSTSALERPAPPEANRDVPAQSDEHTANLPLTIVRPGSGWRALDLVELWRYRDLLYCLAERDIKVRYKQTALGALWAVLQPLLMVIVFTLVLSRMAGVQTAGVPYPLFAMCGFLVWTLFSRAVTASAASVLQSQALITKVYFPRLAIPIATVASALLDFAVALPLLVGMLIYFHWPLTWAMLWAPLMVLGVGVFALGTGALLAALSVTYRDFRHTLPLLIQVWMFATPAIYLDTFESEPPAPPVASADADPKTTETIPAAPQEPSSTRDRIARLFEFNPLTGLVHGFRSAMLGRPLQIGVVAYSLSVSVLMLLVGCYYFRRAERSFADWI